MFNKLRDTFNKYNESAQLSQLLNDKQITLNEFNILTDKIYKKLSVNELNKKLDSFWDGFEDIEALLNPPSISSSIRFSKSISRSKRVNVNENQVISYSNAPPPDISWSFKLSSEFMKSIKKIDKKVQGRILEAISKITDSPMSIVGDTIKPLTSNLSGYWRYRIGDYRLIYKPIEETYEILLITFAARGSVY